MHRIALFLILFINCWGVPVYAEQLKMGWHWYPHPLDESQKVIPLKLKQPIQSKAILPSDDDPLTQLKQIQTELKRKRARAVLYPTRTNILDYLQYQKAMVLDKASLFSDQYRRLVWGSPELNYELKRPTAQFAKATWNQQQRQQIEQHLMALSKKIGLFFYFRSDCPYCHRFAAVLKQLSTQFGFSILPISLDGPGLAEFPNPQQDTGQFAQMSQDKQIVPALFGFHSTTKQMFPVSYGLLSFQELVERLFVVTAAEKELSF